MNNFIDFYSKNIPENVNKNNIFNSIGNRTNQNNVKIDHINQVIFVFVNSYGETFIIKNKNNFGFISIKVQNIKNKSLCIDKIDLNNAFNVGVKNYHREIGSNLFYKIEEINTESIFLHNFGVIVYIINDDIIYDDVKLDIDNKITYIIGKPNDLLKNSGPYRLSKQTIAICNLLILKNNGESSVKFLKICDK